MSNAWPSSASETGVVVDSSHPFAACGDSNDSRPPFIDQELGYFGADRFVLFYYDPRAHQLTWRDSRSFGPGSVESPASLACILDKARASGVSLGDDSAWGDHVLLLDRVDQQACFAYREAAQEFLARRCEAVGHAGAAA